MSDIGNKRNFITIDKGAKASGINIDNNIVIGDANVVNIEGEIEDASITRNKHVVLPRARPSETQEKARGRWGKYAKIIVAFIAVSLFAPIAVNIFTEMWKEYRTPSSSQVQKNTQGSQVEGAGSP